MSSAGRVLDANHFRTPSRQVRRLGSPHTSRFMGPIRRRLVSPPIINQLIAYESSCSVNAITGCSMITERCDCPLPLIQSYER